MPEGEARAQRPAIAVSRVSFTEFYNFCDYYSRPFYCEFKCFAPQKRPEAIRQRCPQVGSRALGRSCQGIRPPGLRIAPASGVDATETIISVMSSLRRLTGQWPLSVPSDAQVAVLWCGARSEPVQAGSSHVIFASVAATLCLLSAPFSFPETFSFPVLPVQVAHLTPPVARTLLWPHPRPAQMWAGPATGSSQWKEGRRRRNVVILRHTATPVLLGSYC